MLFKILLIALLVSPCLFAQGDFSEDVEITIQAGDFLTRLKQIEENPFDLNRVSVRQMFDIPFITRSLARNIVDKRKQHPFKHVAELKQVEGVTEDLFQAIQPYFRIHTASSRFSLRLEQRAAAIAHKARGYLNGVYGNRIALRQRFKISWDNQTNLLLQSEKDAGERNWLDHVSGSLQLQNGKKLMLLLGDYYAVFGHGLVAAGAYGKRLAASGGVTSLIPTVIRLRGKTGVDEVSFLRGAACVLSPSERLQMFIAVSSRQLDGVLTEDSTAIKRLDVSGLHRTETEVARLNLQKETLLQAGIALQFEKASVGVLWQRNKYQKPLQVVAGSYFGGNSFSATFKYHNKSMITSLETAIAPVGTAVLGTLV
ncbi:MAG: helix-hairpin-helix domain-containing protein, partial [Calditrichota bacterium]